MIMTTVMVIRLPCRRADCSCRCGLPVEWLPFEVPSTLTTDERARRQQPYHHQPSIHLRTQQTMHGRNQETKGAAAAAASSSALFSLYRLQE